MKNITSIIGNNVTATFTTLGGLKIHLNGPADELSQTINRLYNLHLVTDEVIEDSLRNQDYREGISEQVTLNSYKPAMLKAIRAALEGEVENATAVIRRPRAIRRKRDSRRHEAGQDFRFRTEHVNKTVEANMAAAISGFASEIYRDGESEGTLAELLLMGK